jgi:hypothetical protein
MTTDSPTGSPAELYPGHAEDLARQARRHEALAAAHATPLPGPLADAFAHIPKTIAGLTVRPCVHYDFIILQQLKSPLLDLIKQAASPGGDGSARPAIEVSDDQSYELIFQFTRPVREMAALVAQGPGKFRARAREEIGYTLGPVEVGLLAKAVSDEIVRAFSTVVKYTRPSSESEGATVFTPPPASPMTASAGGSATSAA